MADALAPLARPHADHARSGRRCAAPYRARTRRARPDRTTSLHGSWRFLPGPFPNLSGPHSETRFEDDSRFTLTLHEQVESAPTDVDLLLLRCCRLRGEKTHDEQHG